MPEVSLTILQTCTTCQLPKLCSALCHSPAEVVVALLPNTCQAAAQPPCCLAPAVHPCRPHIKAPWGARSTLGDFCVLG